MVTLDFDQDGASDVLISNYGAPPTLLRGLMADRGGAWLRVRVCEPAAQLHVCGRASIGAVVRVKHGDGVGPEQTRFYGVGEGLLGHSDRIAHFGLGPHTRSSASSDEATVSLPHTSVS